MSEAARELPEEATYHNRPDLRIVRDEERAPEPPKIITSADIPRGDTPQPTTSPDTPRVEHEADFGRTIKGAEFARASASIRFDEPDTESKYGYFENRRIIGHDTEILGGVYIGGGSREAIVVDDKSPLEKEVYDKAYVAVFEKAKQRMAREGVEFKNGLLNDVYDVVRETLAYDDDYVDKMANDYRDKKINLSVFLDAGKGVCRHQALLTGYLLERLARDGYVGGKVSVQRNAIRGVGAHAWARYENQNGDIYVIDPTQGYIGRLEDAPEGTWLYGRPEDQR